MSEPVTGKKSRLRDPIVWVTILIGLLAIAWRAGWFNPAALKTPPASSVVMSAPRGVPAPANPSAFPKPNPEKPPVADISVNQAMTPEQQAVFVPQPKYTPPFSEIPPRPKAYVPPVPQGRPVTKAMEAEMVRLAGPPRGEDPRIQAYRVQMKAYEQQLARQPAPDSDQKRRQFESDTAEIRRKERAGTLPIMGKP